MSCLSTVSHPCDASCVTGGFNTTPYMDFFLLSGSDIDKQGWCQPPFLCGQHSSRQLQPTHVPLLGKQGVILNVPLRWSPCVRQLNLGARRQLCEIIVLQELIQRGNVLETGAACFPG